MRTKIRQLLTAMGMAGFIALSGTCGLITSMAETRIAFSDPSVLVGNEVTVTMKITSDQPLGSTDVMLSYNPEILEFQSGTGASGGAGAIKVVGNMESTDQTEFSFSLRFKTLKAGTAQIEVTSQEIYNPDGQTITLDKLGNSSVKVASPAGYSDDATLQSLRISPGTLSPEFSSDVTSYTAEVDGSVTDLVVEALASNAGATVTLNGEKGLKTGENQITINVTAEDGQSSMTYTIGVTKAEGGESETGSGTGSFSDVTAQFGDITVDIDGTQYTIATDFDATALPEGFEAVNYSYKGTEVTAGKGLEKDLLILYLRDEGGNGGFYIYNEEADSWSRFVQLTTTSKAIVVVPLDEGVSVPDGLKESSIEIDGVSVTGWIDSSEGEPQSCLLYAMNWNGEKNFYRYDAVEQTIQRYYSSGVSNEKYVELATTYDNLVKDYENQFILLIVVSVIAAGLLIAVVILIRKNREYNWKTEGTDQRSKEILPHEDEGGTKDELPELFEQPREKKGEILSDESADLKEEDFLCQDIDAEEKPIETQKLEEWEQEQESVPEETEISRTEEKQETVPPVSEKEPVFAETLSEDEPKEDQELDDFLFEDSLENLEKAVFGNTEEDDSKEKKTEVKGQEEKAAGQEKKADDEDEDFQFIDL